MADAETDAVRQFLASTPRPAGLVERRERLDALGSRYPLPADVQVEPVDANGVAAEWTLTPEADPSRVILFLHGGGYVSGSLDSHRHMVRKPGGRRAPAPWRSPIGSHLSTRFRRRSPTPSPVITFCCRRASIPNALRSQGKALGAGSRSRCWCPCATGVIRCRLAFGAAHLGSIWRRQAAP